MNDELELLRDWDADAPPLAEPARDRARHQLLNTIVHADGRHPAADPSRRRALRLGTAAVVALAITGTAVVITSDEGDRTDHPGTTTPRMTQAAAVLNGAADRERKQEKNLRPPRDDQYMYTMTVIKQTEVKTGKTKTYHNEIWASVDGSKPTWTEDLGNAYWDDAGDKWPPSDWKGLKKLPTGPEKLAAAIVSMGTSDKPIRDFSKFERFQAYFLLGELLKSPMLPKGLRPAAYEAIALVPGLKTIPGVKDARGRTGVGIEYTGPHGQKGKYLIFDPQTYEYLGFRQPGETRSGKSIVLLSYQDEWGIVDKVKQRP
ncbi:Tat pathway signal protein [Streptomyces sp. A7024]|uniref:Tat pathway signal protein n=1 Tax=Streptomyces coryli TaxID=1128680 RepID=A0A6G4UBP7_9ACTN|nr:CU044_5270 family protein [Streptomyces coryli]NGN68808.1 Tat pathway signal protein [Streptomyces coryli]